jgi:hypothetical protein
MQGLGAIAASRALPEIRGLPAIAPKVVEAAPILHPLATKVAEDVWYNKVGLSYADNSYRNLLAGDLESNASTYAKWAASGEKGLIEGRSFGDVAESYRDAAKLLRGGWKPGPELFQRIQAERMLADQELYSEAGETTPRGANPITDELQEQQTQQNRQMLDEVFDQADQTLLKDRAPDKLLELLDHIPSSTLRIPVEALLKVWKPGAGDLFRNVIPALSQRIQDGPFGSVTAPTNAFLAHIDKDTYKTLSDDIAVGDGLSVNEVKEYKELQQIPPKPEQDVETPKNQALAVGEQVAQHMERLGRPGEEAQRIGQLAAARYYARGVRLGISPRDLFDQENLRFGEPAEGQGFDQHLRGKITFSPLQTTIQLFSSANASTPIHEFGHLWTDELFRDALRPSAPDAVINTRDTLLQALGYKPGEKGDSLSLTDTDHEQAAKWFEQYMRKGKAPSTKLVGIFEAFKRDFTQIYHNADMLGVPISDAVRGVFDHMLATDEEIRMRIGADESLLKTVRDTSGLSLNITGYPWAEDLPYVQGLVLSEMKQRGAPPEEYMTNPLIQKFMEQQKALPKTGTREEAANPIWRAKRTYIYGGKEYKGDEIIPQLMEKAKETAGGVVENNRIMTLVIGPPAAGKSSAVGPMARKLKAAVVGSDEAKDVIPEYRGGVGVYAAHAESTALAHEVTARFMDQGANIILEKIGNNFSDIIPMIQDWKLRGYRVNLVHVHAPIEELMPRMIGRFEKSGRIVDPSYLMNVADQTYPGYQELKPHADEAAAFSTSGKGPDDPPDLVDGEGTSDAECKVKEDVYPRRRRNSATEDF